MPVRVYLFFLDGDRAFLIEHLHERLVAADLFERAAAVAVDAGVADIEAVQCACFVQRDAAEGGLHIGGAFLHDALLGDRRVNFQNLALEVHARGVGRVPRGAAGVAVYGR